MSLIAEIRVSDITVATMSLLASLYFVYCGVFIIVKKYTDPLWEGANSRSLLITCLIFGLLSGFFSFTYIADIISKLLRGS